MAEIVLDQARRELVRIARERASEKYAIVFPLNGEGLTLDQMGWRTAMNFRALQEVAQDAYGDNEQARNDFIRAAGSGSVLDDDSVRVNVEESLRSLNNEYVKALATALGPRMDAANWSYEHEPEQEDRIAGGMEIKQIEQDLEKLSHIDMAAALKVWESHAPKAFQAQATPSFLKPPVEQTVFQGRVVAFGYEGFDESAQVYYVEVKDKDCKHFTFKTGTAAIAAEIEKADLQIGKIVELYLEGGQLVAVTQQEIEKEKEVEKSGEAIEEENSMKQVVLNKADTENTIRPIAKDAALSQSLEATEAPQDQGPVLTTLLNGRFVRGEDNIYRRLGEDREAIADEGTRIRFIDKQMDAFQAGVELAKAKGWVAIEVTGTEPFRSEAWFHAKSAGLEVLGYQPTDKDLKRLANVFAQDSKEIEKRLLSRESAAEFALSRNFGVQEINAKSGRYSGKLIHQTEHHVVQEIGKGVTVIHDKSCLAPDFPKTIGPKQDLRLQYVNGRATADQGKTKSQGVTR